MYEKDSTKNPFPLKPEQSKVLELTPKNSKHLPEQPLLTHFLKIQYELNNQLFKNQILLQAYL